MATEYWAVRDADGQDQFYGSGPAGSMAMQVLPAGLLAHQITADEYTVASRPPQLSPDPPAVDDSGVQGP